MDRGLKAFNSIKFKVALASMTLIFIASVEGKAATKTLSILTQVETSSNLFEEGQFERQASNTLTVGPSLQLTKYWSLATKLTVIRESVSPGRTLLANTPLTVSFTGYQLGPFDVKNKILATLPTDQEVRERDSYQGALGLGSDFIVQSKNRFVPTTVLFGVSLNRNFHEYSQNREGSPNIQYAIRNTVDLGFSITSEVSVNLMGSYRTAWTYQNSIRNSFLAAMTLEYELLKAFNVYGGTSTGERAAYKANGSESNMTLFDENSSELFIGLTYIY